jgi:hypothetical protein
MPQEKLNFERNWMSREFPKAQPFLWGFFNLIGGRIYLGNTQLNAKPLVQLIGFYKRGLVLLFS